MAGLMRPWSLVAVVAVAVAGAGPPARPSLGEQVFFSDVVTVEFTPGKVPKEAAWNDQMELTSRGLATLQPWAPNSSRDFWLRTQPIAGGPSWRPPRGLGITVDLQGIEFAPNSTTRPYIRAFARYSTDRVHWSSWFGLTGTGATLAPETFTGSLSMPQQAQAKYSELMAQWWQTNPAWSSDEHEFCIWLAAHHRDYFASEIPVMGYTQILIEGGGHLRVGGLSVALRSSAGGLQAIPRGERRATADRNWFFDLATIGK